MEAVSKNMSSVVLDVGLLWAGIDSVKTCFNTISHTMIHFFALMSISAFNTVANVTLLAKRRANSWAALCCANELNRCAESRQEM